MEPVSCRYGEDVTLPVDTGDITAVSADIYVGKPGAPFTFTEHCDLVDGAGVFQIPATKTRIPSDTYFYQVNTTDVNGDVDKYPSPQGDCDGCSSSFPEFIVEDALDENGAQ